MEKNVILDVLKKSIRNLLESYKEQNNTVVEDSHITQSLCSCIEAMFLHGEISTQSVGILSRFGRSKLPYEYDFRHFIVEFIPRSLVQTLEHHIFKLTPVGFGRVWLRYSLNESTIISYLESMIKDDRRLRRFYGKDAFIRDEELTSTFCGLLQSIQHLVFNLDTSLPILNTWVNSDALQISGLQHYVPSKSDTNNESNLSSDTIYSEGNKYTDDKSLSLILSNEEEILPVRIYSSTSVPANMFLHPQSISSVELSYNPHMDLHEDDPCDYDPHDGVTETNTCPDEFNTRVIDSDVEHEEDFDEDIALDIEEILDGNERIIVETELKDVNMEPDLMNCVQCLPEEPIDCQLDNTENNEYSNSDIFESKNEIQQKYPFDNQRYEQHNLPQDSFDQLWAQCNLDSLLPIEHICVSNIDESQEPCSEIILNDSEISESNAMESPKVYSSLFLSRMIASTTDFMSNISKGRFPLRFFKVKETEQSWVFIGDDLLTRNSDLKKLMEMFPGVNDSCAKSGENSVFGGLCHKCHKSLETNKVFLDYYDGKLYCFSCESKVKSVIPRDVISNWDFTPKTVSETTKRFLSEIMVHPNINLAANSCLFDVVPELARVRKLRHKLSLLWLQVTSCDMETSTRVRQTMFPREYMLASVKEKDLYSLEDLIILQSGVLEKTLLHVIDKIAIPHVNKCMVCRMKALACDKCRDENNLIYIHEIDYYTECSTPLCLSVIHISCKNPKTKSFYCRRCVQYLENQQPITLASFDTADMND